ncbi:MAG: hypothetical protein HQK69_08800, partial [Desulfamplus sp.]|nr:hypothetical protein [Desulfamplus sp.]
MGIKSNTELKSKALKANMEETRVHVEIEEKYKIILTVFNRYHGLQKELTIFLEELSNPMRNWQFIVSEARRYAFDHIHLFISNSNADKIISLFIDIFHEAIESNQEDTEPKSRGWFQSGYINARAEIQSEAADNLMQFLQKIIKASEKNFESMIEVFNSFFQRIANSSDQILLLFSRSYYRLNKIVQQIIKNSANTKLDWEALNQLMFRYHETTYRSWLNENDPFSWFEQEIEKIANEKNKVTERNRNSEITDRLATSERIMPKDLFESISHKKMESELNKLAYLREFYKENLKSPELTAKLTSFLENNEIIELYNTMPEKLLQAGTTSREGNHWKILFLFHILNIPGLSMIHIATFQDINNTLRWLIEVENAAYIQRLIRQTFKILKLRSEHLSDLIEQPQSKKNYQETASNRSKQLPETIFDSILNMGKGVYNTGESALVHFFLDCVIDAGFHIPIVQGVGKDWQLKDNIAHIKSLRVWITLISMNPSWSIRLISHLIIYISVYGVLIKDTDLFPREITKLLNSPIEPVYNLIKQLTRLFPVYFNEIGAEGAIRDTSTYLDEICHRKDILIHFYRKRIHVESSNRIISMTEAIFKYWLTCDTQYLTPYVPEDFINQIKRADEKSGNTGKFILGVHSDICYLKEIYVIDNNDAQFPSALLNMSGRQIRATLAKNPSKTVSQDDHERVISLITLYKLLYQKYTPSFTEIKKYLEVINTAHLPHIDKLKEALAEQEKLRNLDFDFGGHLSKFH